MGPAGERVAEVVEGATAPSIAVGAVATARTGSAPVASSPDADVGLGQILDAGDAFAGIGSVFAGSWHGEAPGRKGLPGDTPTGGKLFTDPARFPCYRLPDSAGLPAWKEILSGRGRRLDEVASGVIRGDPATRPTPVSDPGRLEPRPASPGAAPPGAPGRIRHWVVRVCGAGVRRGVGIPGRRLGTWSSFDDSDKPTQVPGPLRMPGGQAVAVG